MLSATSSPSQMVALMEVMEKMSHTAWWPLFSEEAKKPYFKALVAFLKNEPKTFPPPHQIFNWAQLCGGPDDVRVVILGQDPYHGDGQAMGLAFSVPLGIRAPPSLQNIFLELKADLQIEPPKHGCLEGWAKQGVLLLNTILTVRPHQAASHSKQGWEQFTSSIIGKLSKSRSNLVFMLWGAHAQKHQYLIDRSKHLILTAPHPSPLSAHTGFFGCKHFSASNAYLQSHGFAPINWKL